MMRSRWTAGSLGFSVCLAAVLIVGCGSGDEAAEAPTQSVHLPSQALSDALSEDEITTFFKVMEDLPGQQAPKFQPLSQVTASDRLRAEQLEDIYRQEYRAMFDAAKHGERWRKDRRLMQTFERFQVQPEDFAALMIRMSCAVAANAIGSQVNLSTASERAETQLRQTTLRIDQLDAAPPSAARSQQRQLLLESLQELVALSEFARILASVPRESRVVIARHRTALVEYLPETGNVEMFERTIEAEILPTSFQRVRPER